MHYEATINGKQLLARTEMRFYPNSGCGSYTPGFSLEVVGERSHRLEISPHPHFDGSCIGGDACRDFIDEYLIDLGFTKVADPEPKKCPTCGVCES